MIPDAYLLDTSKPFTGSTQSILYTDPEGVQRVAYTGRPRMSSMGRVIEPGTPDMTLNAYIHERGGEAFNYTLVSWETLERMLDAHHNTLITNPEPISEERYNELLECLPPCRWGKVGAFTVFHISERLTANLVQWCAQNGSMSCYAFTDRADLSKEELLAKLSTIKN